MTIITYSNQQRRLNILREGEKLFDSNIDYIINDSWEENKFYAKVCETATLLENYDDNDVVVFIDAHDVVLNSNKEEYLEKFKSFDCDILFSSELNCYPGRFKDKMDKIMSTEKESRWLNAGGYMGYVKNIKAMLNWKDKNTAFNMCKFNRGGDQAYFQEYLINHHDKVNIKIDTDSVIFQSMFLIPWETIGFKNGRAYNKYTNVFPCFYHFNAGSHRGKHKGRRINIMNVFIEQMKKTKDNNDICNLDDFEKTTQVKKDYFSIFNLNKN